MNAQQLSRLRSEFLAANSFYQHAKNRGIPERLKWAEKDVKEKAQRFAKAVEKTGQDQYNNPVAEAYKILLELQNHQ